ncbi:MAG: cytochrome C6 [Synechococcaceae bacterium WB9_4xC_028]|nr:cytochrome C6 [Synechococcaceae bacterium WB9_4xB_025]NDD68534.1 cytochrome C6 [Synechococcaceae bacterium WB9_4xC_028]TCD56820.1 cytochrome C6 [Synechococcus sp. BS56D]TCD56945.1 cytochrome C6 [Synechococcus sp. BS55D]
MHEPGRWIAWTISVCLSLWFGLLVEAPVLAVTTSSIELTGDRENGAQLFAANCAGCHMGGGNVIQASRTLSLEDLQAHLEAYSEDRLGAIEYQIEYGRNAMPAYEGKLTDQQIADVASYVEEQAERGWQR